MNDVDGFTVLRSFFLPALVALVAAVFVTVAHAWT